MIVDYHNIFSKFCSLVPVLMCRVALTRDAWSYVQVNIMYTSVLQEVYIPACIVDI